MSGIIIPIAIHFWNFRSGRSLKIGSIQLISEAISRQSKKIRLDDILLLIFRCFLLLVVAMMFAKPYWVSPKSDLKEKGWVLIEKENSAEIYSRFKLTIDSLLSAGYELHKFDPGFEEVDLHEVFNSTDSLNFSGHYWQLLKELQKKIDNRKSIYLFTFNSLDRFTGDRPKLSLNLHWNMISEPERQMEIPVIANMTPADSVQLIKVKSSTNLVSFSQQILAKEEISVDRAPVITKDENILQGKWGSYLIPFDTGSLQIGIYGNDDAFDVNYIASAIEAVRDITRKKINIRIIKETNNSTLRFDWFFWLSTQPLPGTIIAKNIFRYETGPVNSSKSWLQSTIPKFLSTNPIPVYNYIVDTINRSKSWSNIWTDGFGITLLKIEAGDMPVYHFFSRFNPQWSALVENQDFPVWIFELLDRPMPLRITDRRSITVRQAEPVAIQSLQLNTEPNKMDAGFGKFLWFILVVLFLIERLLSFKVKMS